MVLPSADGREMGVVVICTVNASQLCILFSIFLCSAVTACEIKSGAIYPATFPDRGPDEDIRAAGHICQETVRYVLFTYINYTTDSYHDL